MFNVLRADRPRLVSQKTREIGVKNRSCLSCAAASLNDLANRTLVFWAKQAQSWFLGTFYQEKVQRKKRLPNKRQPLFFHSDGKYL